MDIYRDPNITEIIPLVNGTVESHKIPNSAAKINIVISFLGKKIKIKKSTALKEYKIARRFFLDLLSPIFPNISVPKTLNNPIKANDHEPIQIGNEISSIYAGK